MQPAIPTTMKPLLRYPLLALSIISLLAAIWLGWTRLGWGWPIWDARAILDHAPLMISSFLGSLIALERAVALQRRWLYGGPLLSGLGGIVLLLGFGRLSGGILISLAGAVFIAMMLIILRRQFAWYTLTMLVGAISWETGNLLWLVGWPVYRIVLWWMAFLVLTIAAERLELSRLIRLSPWATTQFVFSTVIFLLAALLSLAAYDLGTRLAGAGLVALALWLWRFDIARKTIRQAGLPRYSAICLLTGYFWIGVAGLLGIVQGGMTAGLHYDAFLHSVFIGFVFSMIFAHAAIIFPAVLGLQVRFHPLFYIHLSLLHLSLALRITGDLYAMMPLRLWGGLFNGIAILLFLISLAFVILSTKTGGSQQQGTPGVSPGRMVL